MQPNHQARSKQEILNSGVINRTLHMENEHPGIVDGMQWLRRKFPNAHGNSIRAAWRAMHAAHLEANAFSLGLPHAEIRDLTNAPGMFRDPHARVGYLVLATSRGTFFGQGGAGSRSQTRQYFIESRAPLTLNELQAHVQRLEAQNFTIGYASGSGIVRGTVHSTEIEPISIIRQ